MSNVVNELSLGLNKLNSATLVPDKCLTIASFLGMMQQVFRNQMQFRCLMLSIVHIMEQNKVVSERHKETQSGRNTVLQSNLETLAGRGLLTIEKELDAERLASTISLIARFWISEATISFRQLAPEAQVRYYLSLIAHLLLPYATAEGKREMEGFLER